jgi:hypothetical protein
MQGVDTGIVPGNIDSVTSIGGSLALDQKWGRFQLITLYNGRKSLYRPDTDTKVPTIV